MSKPTVTLSRKQIATILEDFMGWEPIDTRSFWRLAQQESDDPGVLVLKLKGITKRVAGRLARSLTSDQ